MNHNSLLSQEISAHTIVPDASDPILQLQDLRAKVLAGEEVSAEEYAKVLASIRRARTAVPSAKAKGKAAAGPAPQVNFDEF